MPLALPGRAKADVPPVIADKVRRVSDAESPGRVSHLARHSSYKCGGPHQGPPACPRALCDLACNRAPHETFFSRMHVLYVQRSLCKARTNESGSALCMA